MKTTRLPWQFGFWATLWWCANLGREFMCNLRLRSRFRAGVPLAAQDYENCLSGAESLWRRKLYNQGTDIPMEYIVLQNAQTQLQGMIGLIIMAACSIIFGLMSNTVISQVSGFLNTASGTAGLWLTWFLPLVISVVLLIIIQYRVAVPHLWLMIQIGVQYKGLEWIMRKAHSWGMPEAEQTG